MLASPACASAGSVLGGRPDDLYGEVRAVDPRRGYLELRENYGRTHSVRIDSRTRVMYAGRTYPVSRLGRGDVVRVHLDYDRSRQPWADRIELRRDVRADRNGNGGIGVRVERWDGSVRDVDYRRGWFLLDRTRTSAVRVFIGRDTRRDDVRRFERLRRGDRVQVEVLTSYAAQAELVRFR
jgi:hypothetical protein